MKTFSEDARRRIAQGWRASDLAQAAYAARHQVSPRTLRAWLSRYGDGERPVARAKAIIDNAIALLQALRAALDAEEACQVGAEEDAGHEAAKVVPDRHAGPAAMLRLVQPAPDVEPSPRPRRRGGFFSTMDEP